MTRHRKRKQTQKGGAWYNPVSWFSSDNNNNYASGILEETNKKIGDATQSITGWFSSSSPTNEVSNSYSNTSPSIETQPQPQSQQELTNYQTTGGRRRTKRMRGGLGLTYYATPVGGLKVASPDSWQFYADGTNQYSLKAGSRKRKRKNRKSKTRRHKR